MKKIFSTTLILILTISMLTSCGLFKKDDIVDGKMYSKMTLKEKEELVALLTPTEYETEMTRMDEDQAEYFFYASPENPYGSFDDAVSWFENTLKKSGFVSTVSEATRLDLTPIMDHLFTGTINDQPATILIENLPPRPDGETSFVVIHIAFYAVVVETATASQGGTTAKPEKDSDPEAKPISRNSMPGDLIQFGDYVWRVLAAEDGKALIITEYLIEKRPFHDEYGYIYWKESELRAYLNGEFYESFSSTDRVSILDTVLENPINPWFEWIGGEENTDQTIDRIFLLSVDEVVKYFGDSGQLASVHTNDDDEYIDDQYNGARIAIDDVEGSNYNGSSFYWYLRTTGLSAYYAVSVMSDGRINMVGASTNQDATCIRPALWLSIS